MSFLALDQGRDTAIGISQFLGCPTPHPVLIAQSAKILVQAADICAEFALVVFLCYAPAQGHTHAGELAYYLLATGYLD